MLMEILLKANFLTKNDDFVLKIGVLCSVFYKKSQIS